MLFFLYVSRRVQDQIWGWVGDRWVQCRDGIWVLCLPNC